MTEEAIGNYSCLEAQRVVELTNAIYNWFPENWISTTWWECLKNQQYIIKHLCGIKWNKIKMKHCISV